MVDHFKPEDTDIFFLDDKHFGRLKYGDVDIVHHKANSITELLNIFDLPCCKVAMNVDKDTFWVSLQCLYSMLTATYYLPNYTYHINTFKVEYLNINPSSLEDTKDLFNRIHKRIDRYRQKGYEVKYCESNKHLPFLIEKNKLAY